MKRELKRMNHVEYNGPQYGHTPFPYEEGTETRRITEAPVKGFLVTHPFPMKRELKQTQRVVPVERPGSHTLSL